MFWDSVAGVYDLFVNVVNRRTHTVLRKIVASLIQPGDCDSEAAAWFLSGSSHAPAVTRINSRSSADALPRRSLTSCAPCFFASFCALMTNGCETVSIQTKM